METMTGVVESVARTGKSIKIGGAWYGAFAASSLSGANTGDSVKFAYQSVTKDGTVYNNIKGTVTVLGGGVPKSGPSPSAPPSGGGGFSRGSSFPVGPLDPSRAIIRQNALTHASRCVLDSRMLPEGLDMQSVAELVVEIARYYESYVCGDLDMLAAAADA